MIRSTRNLLAAIACASALAIAGCGGSDSTTSTAPPGSTPTTPEVKTVVITGVAATGAAFVGGVVSVVDSKGNVVGTSLPVGDDGVYSVTLAEGATPPFVLVASRTSSTGETQTLVSVVESTDVTTANLTPITTLIASRLSASGDPAKLAEELAANQVQITPEGVAATVQEVKTILGPLLAASGTTEFDPLRDAFATNGSGYDQLLDSISVSIVPSGASANIEVAVKSVGGEDANPPTINFSSDQTLDTIVSDNQISSTGIGGTTIDSSSLAEDGLSVRIADLMQRITACFALPVEQRVSGTPDSFGNVVGTAANVTAPACRSMFVDDNPGLYKHNGVVVQRTASNQGAFASLFRGGSNGLVWSQGSYEFTRANGDYVVGFKIRDAQRGETFGVLAVRKGDDGVLRLIGNQYAYPGNIVGYHQKRNFITLGQGQYSYFSTGYVPTVGNLSASGLPVFDRVIVTSPKGKVLPPLKPSAGQSNLVFYLNSSPTGTSFLRLRSEYVDGSTARPHPSQVESAAVVFAQTELTEEELVNTPSGGTWRFDYFLAGNTGGTPDATQYYRSRSRALSIAELRTKGFAELNPALVADIESGAQADGQPFAGQLIFAEGEDGYIGVNGADGWSVLAGQMPPTSITLYGSYNNVRFNDGVGFSSTARSATVPCSPQTQQDLHCFNGGPTFAEGAVLNGLHLWASDATGREYANFYAMYKLNLAP
ncbi:hypothetical protein [Zeimonas arvi]|uniref:Carboxypeptidase regulatory-like domain-containing protein n=1 Tax=Zeimonas arvi TaxID=2498847 RepID=A0A5C8P0N6_9BURK|nr:hypothetical protein [Zeimonas arvi]TXL66922.1 hypothetical protein FHP08_04660 [Zeimonas arvi]